MSVHDPTFSDEIGAMLEWWRAAGVDCDFTDDATAWLVEPDTEGSDDPDAGGPGSDRSQRISAGQRAEPEAAREVAPVDLLGESPPSTLEEFREFWLTAPGLDAIGPRGRIPPRGKRGAKLMILVVDPEDADRDRLLSGPNGNFVANMLAAMGLPEEDVYFASALPRHTPMADTALAAQAGLAAVLTRHIELAAPERIIAFGSNILPLLQHGASHSETSLREINHSGSSQPIMVSEGLDSLMAMPRLKARFWRRWLEWTSRGS